MTARRRVLRRLDAGPFLILGLLWLGIPLGVWVNWPLPTGQWVSVLTSLLAITAVVYVGSLSGKFMVYPDRLVVENTFLRVVVPGTFWTASRCSMSSACICC